MPIESERLKMGINGAPQMNVGVNIDSVIRTLLLNFWSSVGGATISVLDTFTTQRQLCLMDPGHTSDVPRVLRGPAPTDRSVNCP